MRKFNLKGDRNYRTVALKQCAQNVLGKQTVSAIAHVTNYDFKEFDVIIGADNHILFGNCTISIDFEKKQLRAGHSGWVPT